MAMFKIERTSETWAAVEEAAKRQIRDLRDDLERSLDPMVTEHLRGKIAAFRSVLDLGKPKQEAPPAVDTGGYGVGGPE